MLISLLCLMAYNLQAAPGVPERKEASPAKNLFLEGERWVGLEQYQKAIPCYEEFLKSDPDHEEARLHLGNCLLELDHLEKAQYHFEELVLRHPRSAIAHNNLGTCHAKAGRFDEAILCFWKAHELDPGYESPEQNLQQMFLAMMVGQQASSLPDTGKNEDSLKILESLLNQEEIQAAYAHAIQVKDRTRPMGEAMLRLGIHALRQGQLDQSERLSRIIYECDESLTLADFLLGATRRLQGRPGEAILLLQKAHQACPEDISPALELGLSYAARQSTEDLSRALACYEHVQQIAPQDPRGYILAGFLHMDMEEWSLAEKTFQQALDVDPRWIHAWNGLGKTYFMRDHFEESERCYRHILDLDPTFDEARLNLGYVLWHLGKHHEALALVESVVQSEDPRVRLEAADASLRMCAYLMEQARSF